ncbi:DEAD/DEAH box helicase [Crenothrix polyspora]|uniref:Helicase domain-containing protein n=1 Tax=Crenothrix polyspora TaxID=360316 RepID=A0A1R4H721_9GAMM|nr:type ISP restriction/modification enzyme [Crenothrix polyspora]SJM92052.1 Helicase domain-containing protein [Crenothrix polyspora]
MTALQTLLSAYRNAAQTHREKGTYFEDLICTYLRNEASYKDLYSQVWVYADWAREQDLDARDTGIDLVAKTAGTDEFHAIQCKFYAEDYRIQKSDIDSFFTASGKKPFTHRIIISTTNNWSEHAEDALQDQQPPVSKIDLNDLENSQIDWASYQPYQPTVLKAKKQLRDHQTAALNGVELGLENAERGKLIMACGTGKTFTSLKIAEKLAGKGKRVLFLVPSLSLLSQTLTEWTQETATPLHSFAVCSDSDVGKKRKKDDDIVQTFTHELRYPATTNAARLAEAMAKRYDLRHMNVVFSTYHSIEVISNAQIHHAMADFDLIICDEAHRTTGATFDDADESMFVKVHDADFIKSAKRLYMTATPRIYGDMAKATAEKDNVALCSMDDETLFGQELYVISFSEAVKRELLVDYKVIVLAIDEAHVSQKLQKLLADENNQLKVDDAAKIIGCWKALSKQGSAQDLSDDANPMRRAVAFCQVIEPANNPRTHKVSSKNIASMFQAVVEAYREEELKDDRNTQPALSLECEAAHIDGSMNASEKEAKLTWLKAETPDNTCRVLSNVRCLSEGVDVPALDAVLFLTPRNSQVDVVQSVGRVMRLAAGKKRGYIVLPVVIPAGMEPHKALDDNKTYKVVWQVLQALRAHDDRFDAMINKLDLIGKDTSKMEVIAITDKISRKSKREAGKKDTGKGEFGIGKKVKKDYGPEPEKVEIPFEIDDIQRAIYAKVVKKCGNRGHWEDWANDIAKIARTHITRIQAILDTPTNTEEIAAFNAFAKELRDDLNNAITDNEIVEMLAQHLITKPVFDALFQDYSFAQHNPMSLAMQDILDKLQEHHIDKEADTLQRFYDSVKMRAEGIDNAAGKQKIVVELYDKFFRNAFPRMTEKLGIVYTPVEVVDFIIHSVNDALQNEFGQTLGDKNVHIIDPFTGTGTFITRLLQSGLISPAQLPYKYQNEIHANEIVLLAYYIAAINIEAVYHELVGGAYQPFNGICLTDTFQLYEKDDLVSQILVDNSARRTKQKALDIRVIIGNPPYSTGQDSANDNNANVTYESLDGKIRSTYAANSTATNKNALYDSYIRAIRWASDRVGDSGIIGFVTNAGFIEANTADGLRKCLADEFSSIYIFHLRGNQRTSGELSRREGGKIFGSGSRAPIAITIYIKNPNATENGKIYFHDIGDYLTQTQKLEKISDLKGINGITAADGWQKIIPDQHNDWLNQRDDSFSGFIVLGDKKGNSIKLFENFSQGIGTSRDAWCYNASKTTVARNMKRMIDFYNSELSRFNAIHGVQTRKVRESLAEGFINTNSTQISWSSSLILDFISGKNGKYDSQYITQSLYRPFTKQSLYFDGMFNHRVGQMLSIFPNSNVENKANVVIVLPNKGEDRQFSVIASKVIPDMHAIHGGQCFPLNLYEPTLDAEQPNGKTKQADLFGNDDIGQNVDVFEQAANQPRYTVKDGITDAGLAHFQTAYPNETLNKEDLFYYIYGLLHSEDYKTRYADNLTKELPRIPCVIQAADFWAFSKAGRALAEWHINYETVVPYPVTFDCGKTKFGDLKDADFYVTKMKFADKNDKSTVVYNHKITLKDIPLVAYEYVVNGKPALEWVMERQGVSTHKDSGIVNNANDWAIETMKNARYPLELFQRVITVSLETMKIVNALPPLDITV